MVEKVIKFDGSVEDYDREKIISSIMRAGGSRELAERIARTAEDMFRDETQISTRKIRRVVVTELERRGANDVLDAYLFYDRVIKGRITYEGGKFFMIDDGRLFLGESARRVGSSVVSSVEDVERMLEEFSEDMHIGAPRKEYLARRSRILADAVRRSNMDSRSKERAIRLIADFKQSSFRE